MRLNITTLARLFCVVGSLGILFAPARGDDQEKKDVKSLEQVLKPMLEAHEGKVAVMLRHVPSGETFAFNANEPMSTASLIKLPVLMAMYNAVHDGRVKLDESITLTAEDQVPGSGILTTQFSPGLKLPLRDAAQLMIVYSDNTATNLVIDKIGLDATNALMKSLGCEETRLNSKVFRRDTSNDLERSQQFGLGSTTAGEMVKLIEHLHAGKFVDKETSDKVLAHLFDCADRSKFPRYLPEGVRVAHKTGSVNDVRADAGLVELGDGALIYCVLTMNNADRSWGDDNAAELLAAEVGLAAYDFFAGDELPDVPLVARTLQMGSNGELVEALQRTLNDRLKPSPGISVDGDFGPNTESAVLAFERQAKLTEDGVVDREFWKALGPLLTEDSPETSEPVSAAPEELLPAETLEGPPLTTAKAWTIVDASSGEELAGDESHTVRDPASTTKIMTAYVVLKFAESHPEALDEILTFSKRADETSGSTSALKAGEQVSVGELMYGLLLPSGNDASVALAEHFGDRVHASGDEKGYDAFIVAMNETAKSLGMNDTGYRNPHGLTAEGHVTTAADLAILARAALQLPRFREIVSTPHRVSRVTSEAGYVRDVVWKNTNQLLRREGYMGVKTGTTGPAGACLVSYGKRGDRELLIVVLGSTSGDARYVDCRNLYRWIWRQLEADKTETAGSPGSSAAAVNQSNKP